jgi:hypothetical protein
MDLYQTLQGILNKINDGILEAKYENSEKKMLQVVLDNQARLGEGLLIVGGLLKAILSDEIEVQIMPGKGDPKH